MSTDLPVHGRPPEIRSFERLEYLWERYPQYRERTVFTTAEALLEEHASYRKDLEEEEGLLEEYTEKQYDRFLVQLSWADLPYRYATRELLLRRGLGEEDPAAGVGERQTVSRNPYAEAFLSQFRDLDTDRQACFLFPESYLSQFFVILEVCRRAEIFHPVRNLFPDEDKVHYLAVFDKRDMENVLLMFHLLYTNPSQDLYGGYSLYDYSLPWYQNHLWEEGIVLRSPFLPDRLARYQGSLPYYHNPAKTVRVRRNIGHILESGYYSSELAFFLSLTQEIMPLFQWWYTDVALYEEKDGIRTDWRLARTRIRTRLTAEGTIRPKWKHELTLFHAVRTLYPDTLYQYRPEWLGRQSLDLYIPSLRTAIEYQGVQHYRAIGFFGGEEALQQRQELDRQKRILCEENHVRLIEWPYSTDPSAENIRRSLRTETETAEQ